MSTNKNSGKAEKGSRLYLQQFMTSAKDELSELIIAASPSLLAFVDSKTKIEWKSPLEKSDKGVFYEYRDDFLKVLGLDREKDADAKSELKKFWPKNGPQWDGLATVIDDEGKQKGLLLVEAKAHTPETKSDIKTDSTESILLIKRSIAIAQGHYGIKPTDWTQSNYQLGNRIAFLYYMSEILHIPTWLVLVNFTDGDHKTPREAWLEHYHKIFAQMGIKYDNHKLLNNVIQVFPKCCTKKEETNQALSEKELQDKG